MYANHISKTFELNSTQNNYFIKKSSTRHTENVEIIKGGSYAF